MWNWVRKYFKKSRGWHILYKYRNGRLVDDEDRWEIEAFQGVGFMKRYGIHEVIHEDGTISYQHTCKTTRRGKILMNLYD
jgi:hypothetical protein